MLFVWPTGVDSPLGCLKQIGAASSHLPDGMLCASFSAPGDTEQLLALPDKMCHWGDQFGDPQWQTIGLVFRSRAPAYDQARTLRFLLFEHECPCRETRPVRRSPCKNQVVLRLTLYDDEYILRHGKCGEYGAPTPML